MTAGMVSVCTTGSVNDTVTCGSINLTMIQDTTVCNQKMQFGACPVHQYAFKSVTCMISWMCGNVSIIKIDYIYFTKMLRTRPQDLCLPFLSFLFCRSSLPPLNG